jgi:RimJ/RimL family protein N-acetyltransferase
MTDKIMTDLRFQRMDRDDLETFAAWFADAELRRRISESTEQWFQYVSSGDNNFAWLVYEAERAVGQVSLDTFAHQTGSIGLVVNPELRSQGFGKHILRSFLARAATAHLGEIAACIEADNTASLRCFQGCGFVACPPEPDSNGLIKHVYTRGAGQGAF